MTVQLDERQFAALKEVAKSWKWGRPEDRENIPRWIEEQARKSRRPKLLFAPLTSATHRTAWRVGTTVESRTWRPARHLLGLEAALAAFRGAGTYVRVEEFVTDPTAASANTCRNNIKRAAKKAEQAGFREIAEEMRRIVVTGAGEVFYPGGYRVEIVTSWP